MSLQQQDERIEPRDYLVLHYTRRLTISTRKAARGTLVFASTTLAAALTVARVHRKQGRLVWIERRGQPAWWTA